MPERSGILRSFAVVLFLLFASVICVSQDDKKPTYGILIDNTGSMRNQFQTVVQLSKSIVHQVHDRGPVSIFSFASAPTRQDFRAKPTARVEQTQDEELLNRTIDDVYVQGGQTTLFDAIEMMIERLSDQAPVTDKFVVLITDGEERASTKNQKEVLQKLRDRKIKVYAIGLVQELPPVKRAKATDLLKLICRETGGRAVFAPGNINVQSVITDLALPIR
jgi:uncharacterized protein with von Willebrand factor type A (vWA) domain